MIFARGVPAPGREAVEPEPGAGAAAGGVLGKRARGSVNEDADAAGAGGSSLRVMWMEASCGSVREIFLRGGGVEGMRGWAAGSMGRREERRTGKELRRAVSELCGRLLGDLGGCGDWLPWDVLALWCLCRLERSVEAKLRCADLRGEELFSVFRVARFLHSSQGPEMRLVGRLQPLQMVLVEEKASDVVFLTVEGGKVKSRRGLAVVEKTGDDTGALGDEQESP